MIENKDYDIAEDNFIYGQDTKKNSPDLIGFEKENKIIPMALYNDGSWEMDKNAPFVEIKTFKNNQKLVTIPESQFDENKYYIIVESNLENDYLLNLFDDKFFEECDLEEFETPDEFIKSDGKLIRPESIEKPENIGYYELLGIYRGLQIKEICKTVGKGEYYYLNSIRPINSKDKTDKELNSGLYCHSKDNIDCFSFCIQKEKDSKIFIRNEGKTYLDILVKSKVKIDTLEMTEGKYRLNFKKFQKTSDSLEVVVPRNTLKAVADSSHEELIKEFDRFIENYTKNQSW